MKRRRARLSAVSKLLKMGGYALEAGAALVVLGALAYALLLSRGIVEQPEPGIDAAIAYLSVRIDVQLSRSAAIALSLLRGTELALKLAFYGFISLLLSASVKTAGSGADFDLVSSVLFGRSGAACVLSAALGAFLELGIALVLSAPVAAAGYASSPGFDIEWPALAFGMLLIGLSFVMHDFARAKHR